MRGKGEGNTLATAFCSRTIVAEKQPKTGETAMPIAPYRVSAYNTAKLSENKMHDDTVAKRFGFSGGLVPGVDVMAYMMHMPVAKWGRAFLERGLIEARFVKPVYDGETADVTAAENNGVLSIEVMSRGQLCATGTASLPAAGRSLLAACSSAALSAPHATTETASPRASMVWVKRFIDPASSVKFFLTGKQCNFQSRLQPDCMGNAELRM